MFNLLNSQPIRLLLTIILTFSLYTIIPHQAKQFFFSVSLIIKEILILMIPLIIFSSVYNAFANIRGKAIYLMLLLVICVIISNFFSVSVGGLFSYFTIFADKTTALNPQNIIELTPLWKLNISRPISNNVVLIVALTAACISQPIFVKNITRFNKIICKIVDVFLNKFFIPILPIFIFGFLLKLLNDNLISDIISFNLKACIYMVLMLATYLAILYISAVTFYGNQPRDLAQNLVEPAITAFTSMSSAAALPFSLKAAASNTGNKDIADIVMPATANIHMIGDSICIPIMAMIILATFGHPMPTLAGYLTFAGAFTITKFSGAGVPGGSIMVMIPVLESTLGFTPEMIALITIFYMLLDPITTLGNVLGNNAFVIHFNKLYLQFVFRKLDSRKSVF